MSKRRKPVIHLLPQIVARDGDWKCHYCGCNLVPLDASTDDERYFQLVMFEAAHPMTLGDGNGYYTYEQCTQAIELAARGDLVFWVVSLQLKKGYEYPEADHVIPVAKGGTDDLENLVACCRKCNQRKRDKDYAVFMAEMRRVQS